MRFKGKGVVCTSGHSIIPKTRHIERQEKDLPYEKRIKRHTAQERLSGLIAFYRGTYGIVELGFFNLSWTPGPWFFTTCAPARQPPLATSMGSTRFFEDGLRTGRAFLKRGKANLHIHSANLI